MRLRFPFTVTLVAALAVTPALAQSRRDADDHDHIRIRVVERIAHQIERVAERVGRTLERQLDRLTTRAERGADRIASRIEARVHAHVRSIVNVHIDASAWAFSTEQGAFDGDPCQNLGRRDRDDYYTHCEVREERLPAGPLNVNAAPNGGIRVEGWDRNEILVRAIVQAHARDLDEAKRLGSGVQIQAGGGRVAATGPDAGRREWWSVSYRINVPRKTDLDLSSHNGGISIAGVTGTLRFDTHNGGVTLADLAGSVRGETQNGGVNISLAGQRWDGDGLDVETSNGGVTLAIPENYNAQLDTRTVNGGFRSDYPLTIVGELTPRRGISTTLGSGGPTVRVRTTNGGLNIRRR